jgi:hypothetical protein
MAEVPTCKFCGIPLFISQALHWEDNGVISLPSAPGERMAFYYTETIDGLFQGIQELIGIPINNIVVESRRREVRRYIEGMFPREITQLLKSGKKDIPNFFERGKRYNLQVNMIGTLYGYGDIRPSDDWEKEHPYPWRSQIFRNPYSLLFCMADTLGAVEAIEGTDLWVESENLGDDAYRITALEGGHPLELRERLRRRRYTFKPGDLSFRRCSSCDTPMEISHCQWDLEEGTIFDSSTGRRMALFGSAAMDAVFDDLEAELGKTIPELTIEAQRRLVKSYVSEENWQKSGWTFKSMVALQGLGNLTRFTADKRGLELTIQNSCLHLPMIGFTQAAVELVLGAEKSTCDWELSPEGDLSIVVKTGSN